MDIKLIKNYYKALEQKYNAVCFDIDGTLTKINSAELDERILPDIAYLLKKRIPVVFITGRGETGLCNLKDGLVENLKNNYNINSRDLHKLYALTNDGARIFFTSNDSEEIFNISQYTIPLIHLKKLNELNNVLLKNIKDKELSKYCKITYSEDKKLKILVNIRIMTLTNDNLINREILNIISHLIVKFDIENINLTVGVYKGNQIFQIGTVVKSEAIQVTEKIIGIPQNSMLRIGDCGNEIGNDYSMLNCTQGFSVNKRSGEIDKCFPVLDQENNILKGVDATLSLLKNAKLIPTICLEHVTEKDYKKAYAKIEKQLNLDRNKRIAIFNNIINEKFKLTDGMYGLYDKFSGSIKIPMYEWISIDDDNLLKELWNKQNLNSLNYALYDNESILLRGSRVYYYFLSNRFHDEKTRKDITSKDMIYIWLNNNKQFYIEALNAVYNTKDINDLNNNKMILGIVDNIRNELLILLNQRIINVSIGQNLIINLETVNDELIYNIYNTLLNICKLMEKITFEKSYKINSNDICGLLNKAISITTEFQLLFANEIEKDNYSKDFRAYREIDNFAENFVTCYLSLKNNKDISNKGFCGLSYGGIELPIIMKSINDEIKDVSILKFNKNVTGYSKKQSLELRFFDIFNVGGIKQIGIDKDKKYILLDDNLLTGKTMQLALTSLYDIKINVDKIVVVRYPGVNRISQMFMPNHGAVDYRYFFDFIEGLYFPSPYSWRDPNSLNPYEDSLGVFDLNRRKIIECLAKNGDYSKNSEVLCIKGMTKF